MLKATPARDREFALYDCFAVTRFGGNVGGLVLDAAGMSDKDMQHVAREINAPVTGFVMAMSSDAREIDIRFFMPQTEIAMCGHVTIGLVTHLGRTAPTGTSLFRMTAPAGPVNVRLEKSDTGTSTVLIDMAHPKPIESALDQTALLKSLGLPEGSVLAGNPSAWDAGLKHLFVPLPDVEAVNAISPDFAELSRLQKASDIHTVACFAMAGEDQSGRACLVIRDFCPSLGVNETPASGTTNAALAGYLLAFGFIRPISQTIVASQGEQIGRASEIISEIVVEDGHIARLAVGGQAIPSLSGVIPAL